MEPFFLQMRQFTLIGRTIDSNRRHWHVVVVVQDFQVVGGRVACIAELVLDKEPVVVVLIDKGVFLTLFKADVSRVEGVVVISGYYLSFNLQI